MDSFCSPAKNHLSPSLRRENVDIPVIEEGNIFNSREEVVSKVKEICRLEGKGYFRPKHVNGEYRGNCCVRFTCASSQVEANDAYYDGEEEEREEKDEGGCSWHVAVRQSQSKREDKNGIWTVQSVSLLHDLGCNCVPPKLTVVEAMENPDFVARARGAKDNGILATAEEIFQYRPSQSFAQKIRKSIEAADNLLSRREFKALNSWLEEFIRLNPGSSKNFRVSDDKTFLSCMLAHSSIVDITEFSSYRVFALDAGFTHVRGWRGQVFVLTVTDGNHQICPLAIGLYGVESGDNYADFLKYIKSVGDGRMGDLMNSEDVIIFTDRHKSFSPALRVEVPKARHMYDFLHILRNMEDNRELNRKGHLSSAWGIAKATTKSMFDERMAAFKLLNEPAADYLATIPVKFWTNYTIREAGLVNYLKFGSNDVESEMNRFIGRSIRHELPLVALMNFGKLVGSLIGIRSKNAFDRTRMKCKFTKYAEESIVTSSNNSSDYKCDWYGNREDGEVSVWHHLRPQLVRVVNWRQGTCYCAMPLVKQLPCAHVYRAATLLGVKGSTVQNKFVGSIYQIQNYSKAYKGHVCLPNNADLSEDDTKPPPYVIRRGKIAQKRKKGKAERGFGPLKHTITDAVNYVEDYPSRPNIDEVTDIPRGVTDIPQVTVELQLSEGQDLQLQTPAIS